MKNRVSIVFWGFVGVVVHLVEVDVVDGNHMLDEVDRELLHEVVQVLLLSTLCVVLHNKQLETECKA